MKKMVVLFLIAMTTFALTAYSMPENGRMLHKMVAKLKLTDSQKKDFDNAVAEMQKEIIAQKAKIATVCNR